MPNYKLLPIPLLVLSMTTLSYAEHVSLPTLSVEGVAGEVAPYALPALPASTADLGDMVKRLPGANVNRNGIISSIAQYRGLFGHRVNVKLDGTGMHEAGPNSMDAPLSYLASSRTGNVSVYRGIAPVRTGIETIGGTIEAESKRIDFATGDEFELHGNLVAGYASLGHTRQSSVTTGFTNKNHRIQISGSSDRGDDLDFKGGTIRPTKQDRDTLGLHYGYQNQGHKHAINIEHIDFGVNGTAALPMDIIFFRGERYNMKHSDTLANGNQYDITLRYQDIDHKMDNYSHRTNLNPMMHRFVTPDVQAGGISFSYNMANWTVGFDADQAEHNATVFNPNNAAFFIESFNDVERDRYSIFTEWQGEISEHWEMEAGLRYSRIEMDAGNVDSFAGLPMGVGVLRDRFNSSDLDQEDDLVDVVATFTRELTDNVGVEVGFARKTRAPSYHERYLWIPLEITAGLADGNNYVGDVDLDHEVAYQYELGLDWHSANFVFSPRVFYHHIDDYIQGVADATDMVTNMVSGANGDTTPLKYSNVDAKLYGLDANWLFAINSEWQLDGTVSYVRGKRRDTSDDLYRIAPLTARTMLSYVQPKWRVAVEAETIAKQNKVSDENDEDKTGGYALYHLSGQYQATDAITLSAGVNNLFNRHYTDHLGGYNRAAGNPDIAVGDRLPGVGRSAYINASVNF